MLTVCSIAPVIESDTITEARYQSFMDQQFAAWQDIKVIGKLLDHGPSSVENEMDDALAVPGVLRAGLAAKEQGAKGILIDCMLDPGLKALRTALDIPVVGAAEISFRLAATLGHKFGIIDVCDDTGPMVAAQVSAMGLSHHYAGLRSTGLGVEEIEKDKKLTQERLIKAAVDLIEKDGANILVFGCTEFSSHADELRRALCARKLDAPVINPTALAMGTLIAVARSGAAHSKLAFPTPAAKKSMRGFEMPEFYHSVED